VADQDASQAAYYSARMKPSSVAALVILSDQGPDGWLNRAAFSVPQNRDGTKFIF